MNIVKASILLLIILFSMAMSQDDLPQKPESWVSDYAAVLSGSEKEQLIEMLGQLEQRSSNQIYIAIFNKLPQNYYLEDYAVKLFKKWRPGLEKQDNGVLIIVFIQNRKIRIEVGYGLEDVVTDAQSSRLINNYITPEFHKGNYFAGLKSALDVLIPLVEGKYKIPLEEPSEESSPLGIILLIVILVFFISRFQSNRPAGLGSKSRGKYSSSPFLFGGFGGFGGGSSGGGGGFSGGFGGMSGGGGASGGW